MERLSSSVPRRFLRPSRSKANRRDTGGKEAKGEGKERGAGAGERMAAGRGRGKKGKGLGGKGEVWGGGKRRGVEEPGCAQRQKGERDTQTQEQNRDTHRDANKDIYRHRESKTQRLLDSHRKARPRRPLWSCDPEA